MMPSENSHSHLIAPRTVRHGAPDSTLRPRQRQHRQLTLLAGLLVVLCAASSALLAGPQENGDGPAETPTTATPTTATPTTATPTTTTPTTETSPTEASTGADGAVTGAGPAAPAVSEEGASIPTTAWEVANAMGIPFTAAFVVASVIALWTAIERLVMLRRRRVIPRAFVDRFLMHLRTGRMEKVEALTVCQQNQSPIADIFMHGVRKWGKPSVEIEQAILDGGERQIGLLKARLRVLNGVATITPLIGLLGTVVGMIQSFNKIAVAQAMGQSNVLAAGIALALLTTAAGLLIAIPALTTYMYLAGRVDSLVMEMDRLGQELVYLISAESLRERAVQPAEKSAASAGTSAQPVRKTAAATGPRPETQ